MGELQRSITQAEFNEWMHFLSEEPLMSERNEIQMSILLHLLSSFMGAKSSYEDFLLSKHLKTKQMQNDEILNLTKLQNDVLTLLG